MLDGNTGDESGVYDGMSDADISRMKEWEARVKAKPKFVSKKVAQQWNLMSTNMEEAKALNAKSETMDQSLIDRRLAEATGAQQKATIGKGRGTA